jgi:hypothetical protein
VAISHATTNNKSFDCTMPTPRVLLLPCTPLRCKIKTIYCYFFTFLCGRQHYPSPLSSSPSITDKWPVSSLIRFSLYNALRSQPKGGRSLVFYHDKGMNILPLLHHEQGTALDDHLLHLLHPFIFGHYLTAQT